MTVAKGMNSWVGFGAETTYGSAGTRDLFHRIVDCSLRHVKDPFLSEQLNYGWDPGLYFSSGRNEGSIVFEQTYTGLELFWHSLMGTYTYNNDSPVAGTDTHAFTYVESTNDNPSLSVEAVRGVTGKERTYLGMYVKKAIMEFSPRQVMRTTFEMVGQGYSVGAATSESFPTFVPVLPSQKTALQLGGNTFTMRSGRIEIETARAEDREHYGETWYKEPVVVGRPMATFSFDCEFGDDSGSDVEQFLQDYEAGTLITGPAITHLGDIITGATQYQFGIQGTSAVIFEATPVSLGQNVTGVTVNGRILAGLAIQMINDTNEVT